MLLSSHNSLFFFFNDPATTEIYTLSLHDALPILERDVIANVVKNCQEEQDGLIISVLFETGMRISEVINLQIGDIKGLDRKSTRVNSSHPSISYAVFCLKKKKKNNENTK